MFVEAAFFFEVSIEWRLGLVILAACGVGNPFCIQLQIKYSGVRLRWED